MSAEPTWLDRRALLDVHDATIARDGGLPGLRDEGLLESALARPLQLFHYGGIEDVPTLAAAYAVALARNHAFFDGNKRAAFAALGLFLLANGLRLTAPPAEATRVMIAVAASELDEEAFAAWVGRNVSPRA
ncbi:type II toxin-antitoxin system death-on-curing family toxin [Segnochrobactrum spirostomi]|uniref:Type II toxin-antitoxin system death-on-curing family toxin n=1 Tax=Segnochrobactrum spirostomi TaxID=2608987 RepID=A0A6A7Y6W1_9HYPH|nr:type II toxin-antitoxin system death-on-curing family toxin [Segnochrobactrum spirostomi]MQT13821.1 type II toxin-antitoxin system death-on-curing family toxin [Segnochrobactrum spirostomi]